MYILVCYVVSLVCIKLGQGYGSLDGAWVAIFRFV